MKKFIACDWGTTTFRLRLVDTDTCAVIAEEKNEKGIADTYALWKQTNANAEARTAFYVSVINEAIKKIENDLAVSLDDVPVMVSGMASATIGMMELPYAMLPFSMNGYGLIIYKLQTVPGFEHPVYIISGARSETDVMRGEETQLIGASQISLQEEQLFIFPGTHSKHITVKNGQAIHVKTYMTGEFFELLSKKSVLAHSIESGQGIDITSHKNAFEKGVKDSEASDLLHHAFSVRFNDLFKTLSKQENYYYLSGLLIGAELNQLKNKSFHIITVVSNEMMFDLYSIALHKTNSNIQFCNVDEAIVRGQMVLIEQLGMTI